VLERVGLTYENLVVENASLSHWGEFELHKLVATFLQVRVWECVNSTAASV
jgi:hypothetical protein